MASTPPRLRALSQLVVSWKAELGCHPGPSDGPDVGLVLTPSAFARSLHLINGHISSLSFQFLDADLCWMFDHLDWATNDASVTCKVTAAVAFAQMRNDYCVSSCFHFFLPSWEACRHY